MQSSKAAQLRQAWEAKGNPSCDIPTSKRSTT